MTAVVHAVGTDPVGPAWPHLAVPAHRLSAWVPEAIKGTGFPKFVLGFLIASVVMTAFVSVFDPAAADDLRNWFLILAFVSIGLEFSSGALKEAGRKPVVVFLAATIVYLGAGLLLALVLWGRLRVLIPAVRLS